MQEEKTQKVVNVKQELIKTGNASATVIITVDDGDTEETTEYQYSDTNFIFPLYNSLINTIADMEDVNVHLKTNDSRFAREINGNPNKHTSLLNMLQNVKERNQVTVYAY